jgi:hypothetical protein
MYIGKVILKNIRGFTDLYFDLMRPSGSYAGWTVFTGDNGSGKSTLLKAIAVGLTGKDTARALQPSFHRWIREGAGDEEASIQLEIVRRVEDDTLVDPGAKPGGAFPAKITLKNGGKETTLQSAIPAKKPKNYSTPDRTLWSTTPRDGFLAAMARFAGFLEHRRKRPGKWSHRPPSVSSPCFRKPHRWPRWINGYAT